MAPEFFPFIGFGFLRGVGVAGFAVATGLFVIRLVLRHRGSPRWARRLVTALCCASVVVFMVVSLCLVLLGGSIRQQFYLNEPFVTACGDGDLAKAEGLLAR